MPKHPIPKHLIGEMNPRNKEWIEEYKLWKETKENYHDAGNSKLQPQ